MQGPIWILLAGPYTQQNGITGLIRKLFDGLSTTHTHTKKKKKKNTVPDKKIARGASTLQKRKYGPSLNISNEGLIIYKKKKEK